MKFDDAHITVRQRLCEALNAAGRKKDAGESLLDMVNTFNKEVYASVPITAWVSGELMLYPFVFCTLETLPQTSPNNIFPRPKAPVTPSRTQPPHRLGKINTVEWQMERCLGCCCQCE